MKKAIGLGLIWMLTVPAMAQIVGLPIAGGAGLAKAGSINVSGGAVLGDDFNLYGIKGGVAVMENLSLFGDVGVLDPDQGDTGWALQGGGLFTLPLQNLPVDIGLRATLGYAGYDLKDEGDLTFMSLNAGVLVSKTIKQFTPYAFLGINHVRAEADVKGFGKVKDNNTDPAFAGGVEFALTEQFSIYGEVAHIDDPFFGFGGRIRF